MLIEVQELGPGGVNVEARQFLTLFFEKEPY